MIGTISFSLQGGMIAMEKKYDLFAVYLFGIITAFGGGALRYVFLGANEYNFWNQDFLFTVSLISITAIILFPNVLIKSQKLWSNVLDAIGIIAFAIQGAISAVNLNLPASAAVVAAMLTATGGGIFRDLLSQRRPILLGENIYVLWIFLTGLVIGLRWATTNVELIIVFIIFTSLRLLTYFNQWKIPYRNF